LLITFASTVEFHALTMRVLIILLAISFVIAQQYEYYSTEENKTMVDYVDHAITEAPYYVSFDKECYDLSDELYADLRT